MKKILLVMIVLAVGLCGAASANDYKASSYSHTITAADTVAVTNRDTVSTNAISTVDFGEASHLWFVVEITNVDTNLTNDSVIVEFQWSFDGSTWTYFDSLRINTTSTNDTFVVETTRMNLDSTATGGARYIRARFYEDYDVDDGDSTIVGNTYTRKHKLWVIPRF